MIIQCDECQAKFKLDDSKISDKGAKVRCSKCKHVFTVYKEPAAPPVEEPAAPPVEEPAAPPVEEPAAPPVEEPAAPPVEEPAAPPVEEEYFGMDMSDNEDLFGEGDDSFDGSREDEKENDESISSEDIDEDTSWGGLAGNLDGLDIEFEEPDSDKASGEDISGFGMEGEDETAGFGMEGEDETAGFGMEGEDETAGFGMEGEDETAGFGMEGEDEVAGFGMEGEDEVAGFGMEGEDEVAGFGMEGEGESAGFGMEGEDEVAGFGLEGEGETAGFGLEGEGETAGFGMEGEDEAAGFGMEGEGETAGFGLEGEGETAGFGLEGEGETAGFGLEGEGESAGFELEGEGETEGSNNQPDSGYADLDLDTGPDLSDGLDVTESPDEIPDEQEAFNRSQSENMADEQFENATDIKADTKINIAGEKKTSKALILFLTLILILGGAYYIVVSKAEVVIAGYDIGQILRNSASSIGISSEAKRPGKIEINDLNGYYLQSEKDGLIFIIEGSALNNFGGPRSFISIKGTLFDGSGKPVMEERAFCGNTFSKDELATLSRKKISMDLQSRLGKGLINSNIPPGKKIPFMLVFYSTPDNLAEFNVEVTGSEDAMQNAE